MMTNEQEVLKPCPFCGNDTPDMVQSGTSRHSCIVECGWCRCRHESGDEGAQSGTSWNTRADDAIRDQEAAKHAPQWQPIETAPKDGFHVLLYKPEICYVGFWSGYNWCANARGVPVIDDPTHWMPLPAAPELRNAKEV